MCVCMCAYACMGIYIVKSKVGDPFQYLLHRGAEKGAIPFPELLLFTLRSVPYNARRHQVTIFVFGMTQSGIEPQSPEPLANTLLI